MAHTPFLVSLLLLVRSIGVCIFETQREYRTRYHRGIQRYTIARRGGELHKEGGGHFELAVISCYRFLATLCHFHPQAAKVSEHSDNRGNVQRFFGLCLQWELV